MLPLPFTLPRQNEARNTLSLLKQEPQAITQIK